MTTVTTNQVEERALMDLLSLELGFDFADLETKEHTRIFSDERNEVLRIMADPITEDLSDEEFEQLKQADIPAWEVYRTFSAFEEGIDHILRQTLPPQVHRDVTYTIWTADCDPDMSLELTADMLIGAQSYQVMVEKYVQTDVLGLTLGGFIECLVEIAAIFRVRLIDYHQDLINERESGTGCQSKETSAVELPADETSHPDQLQFDFEGGRIVHGITDREVTSSAGGPEQT